ncbi:MAG: reverse transcriptase domain-containing protein, partial [Terriglobia bacterium]
RKVAKGDVIVVRYADDLVVGFQHRTEAERFLKEFRERLAKFGLELHPDKTRLIEFGRFAVRDRKARGEGKPETFTFLGFTHYCGQRHKSGTFTVGRITAKKRMVAKLKAIKVELQRRMHDRMPEVGGRSVMVVPTATTTPWPLRRFFPIGPSTRLFSQGRRDIGSC